VRDREKQETNSELGPKKMTEKSSMLREMAFSPTLQAGLTASSRIAFIWHGTLMYSDLNATCRMKMTSVQRR